RDGGNEEGNAETPGRNPGRKLREAMDRRKQERPSMVRTEACCGTGAATRERRRRVARHDVLPQSRSRQTEVGAGSDRSLASLRKLQARFKEVTRRCCLFLLPENVKL